MPAPRNPWTQRVYDMAAEGKWTKEQMIRDAMQLVPVGRGARQTQREREQAAKFGGYRWYEQGEHYNHHPVMWRRGQRRIVSRTVLQLLRRRRLIEGDDGIVRLSSS